MAYVKSDRRSQRAFLSLRLAVLVALLALSTALGAMHQFQKGARPVGVDALCPFGAIEAAYTLLASGSLIERVSWSSYALLLATVLAALLFPEGVLRKDLRLWYPAGALRPVGEGALPTSARGS